MFVPVRYWLVMNGWLVAKMAEKKQALGVCDDCLGAIPPDRWYTSKGKPRLYCSRECVNTGNSRAGAPIRSAKAKQRVASGEWQNPALLHPPTPQEQARRARLGRKREVENGRWQNPALSAEAKEKLSRPRKHDGALHRAIEKLGQGAKTSELTAEEQAAHLAYRQQLRDARRKELNAGYRQRYRERWVHMTEEQREQQRAKWRAANKRKREKKRPNL